MFSDRGGSAVVSRKTIIAVVVVMAVLITGVVAYYLWFGDERAIRKQLVQVKEMGSKGEAEQPVDGLVKATKIAALFSDPCRLIVESVRYDDYYYRKHIQEHVMLVRSLFAEVEVSLHDVAISRIVNKTATVRGTLRLHGRTIGEPVASTHECQVEVTKIDGKWLFTSVTIVEIPE